MSLGKWARNERRKVEIGTMRENIVKVDGNEELLGFGALHLGLLLSLHLILRKFLLPGIEYQKTR